MIEEAAPQHVAFGNPARVVRRHAALVLALAVTAVILVVSALLQLGPEPVAATPLPQRLLGVLVATALLLTAVLAAPPSPALAWGLGAIAAAVGLIDAMTVIRSLERFASGAASVDLALLGAFVILGSTSVGAGFAVRRRRPSQPWSAPLRMALVFLAAGVAATAGFSIWAVAAALGLAPATIEALDMTPTRVATRLALLTLAWAIVVGLTRDVGPPAMRAWRRRTPPPATSGGRLWQLAGLLVDELLPGRGEERRRAAESERARLAADLHALVLPELRRAAATAESAGVPTDVQVDLRRALEDVEQLMHLRQSVVLEQFGLVAALEWLAERTEERSRLRVQLALDGNVPDGARAIEPAVARAAFRIALLALDNVVRHAGASLATVRLAGATSALTLEVTDDGSAAGSPDRVPGRGLADMRAEAAASGGALRVSGASTVRVEVSWPLAVGGARAVEAAVGADQSRPPNP